MARTKASEKTMIFRGPPRRLRLHSDIPDLLNPLLEADEKLIPLLSQRRSLNCRTDREGKLRKLGVRLSDDAPPGEYHATLKSEGASIPVAIHVEARPRLVISPRRLEFQGKKGGKPKAHLLFANKGNVTFEIPKISALSMCDDSGIDNAFTSTFLMDSIEIGALFGNFISKIRASHGGLMNLRVTQGSGLLESGQQREAIAEAQFTDRFKAGHSYHGLWGIDTAKHLVCVTVTT